METLCRSKEGGTQILWWFATVEDFEPEGAFFEVDEEMRETTF